MKEKSRSVRRQIFVFTPEEKKAAACVLAIFFLGVATKYYRDTHVAPPSKLTPRQQYQAERAAKAARAYARSARGQREVAQRASTGRPSPTAAPETDDEDE